MEQLIGITEAVSRAAYRDHAAAAPEETLAATGLAWAEIEGAAVMTAPRSASPLYNRAVTGSADPDHLARLADYLREHGSGKFFIQLPAAHRSEALEAALVERGIARYRRSWATLIRSCDAPPAVETDLTLRLATAADAGAAGHIFCAGFDMEPAFAPMIGALIGRPRWRTYVACEGDQIAGVGMLYLTDEMAYLAGGVTAPAFRQRGVQRALMAHRIAEAGAAGCRHVFSETGEAVPGDPQHSYRNMERLGLQKAGVIDNYVPAPK